MLVSDYSSTEEIKLSDIQFLIAIALDYLGELEAAKKTLRLFSDVEQLELFKEIEARLKNSNNIVKSFLTELDTNKYYKTRNSSLYKTYKSNCLSELLTVATLQDIYLQTMRLMVAHNASYYIALYMDTNMWDTAFRKNKKALPNGMMSNEDTVLAVKALFKEQIIKDSANGSYNSLTRTPDAFLFYCYNNFFICRKEFRDILNAKSIMKSTNSDDKRSIVDKYLDANEEDSYIQGDLDFKDIATKLYEASYSLFNHGNDKGIAYSDLLTWYKNNKSSKVRKDNKKAFERLKQYFILNITDDIITQRSNEELKKQNARYKVCEKFGEMLDSGFALEDIYPFYLEIVNESDNVSGNGKDGLPLYSSARFKSKKSNNAEKFQKHIEGFVALKQLIEYIRSPRNKTGATIFTFPTQIFRDKRLIRRFNSIEEYIVLHEDVISLVNKASTVEKAITINDDGLYNNDIIYDKVSKCLRPNSGSYMDDFVQRALDLNLAQALKSTVKNEKEIFKELIENPAKMFMEELGSSQYFSHRCNDYNLLKKANLDISSACVFLLQVCKAGVDCFKNPNSSEIVKQNIALTIIKCFDAFFAIADKPIEVDGSSTIGNKDLLELLTEAGVSEEKYANYLKLLLVAFKESSYIVFNTNADDISLITIFNLVRIVNSLDHRMLNCYNDIMTGIRDANASYNGNYYLCYAEMLYRHKILNFVYPVKEIAQVYPYLNYPYIVDTEQILADLNDSNIIEIKKRDNSVLLNAINYNLSFHNDLFIFFGNFKKLAEQVLTTSGNAEGLDPRKAKVLSLMSARIESEEAKTEFYQILQVFCEKFDCNFDKNGYLMKNGNYVTIKKKNAGVPRYIHRFGYAIITGVKDSDISVDLIPEFYKLEQQDIDLLELNLR